MGYASAKIASIRACQCAEDQYGISTFHPVPCSLFGFKDNYDLETSHFIPAAIRKIYQAAYLGVIISFWGSGTPLREFMF